MLFTNEQKLQIMVELKELKPIAEDTYEDLGCHIVRDDFVLKHYWPKFWANLSQNEKIEIFMQFS